MEDGTYYIHGFDPCLLELLAGPLPERYVLRAEVRHVSSEGGEVGIYFAYRKQATAQGVEHCYLELHFNDLADGTRWARLQLRRRREKGLLPPLDNEGSTMFAQKIKRARPGERPWRALEVRVAPSQVEVFWEGKRVWGHDERMRPARALSRSLIVDGARRILKDNPDLDPDKEFLPRGSLGLYVNRSGASFRRVVIEPMK
jgi:hypothetical protein